MYLDATFWSQFFRHTFARQIGNFCDVFQERVLPAFAGADREADEVAEREYDRIGSGSIGDGGPIIDPATVAEMALESGLAHYLAIMNIRQVLLNLAATALWHMFEQQLLIFHRRQVLSPSEERDPELNADLTEMWRRLAHGGIDRRALGTWSTIDELRVTANTIKHGEGDSARKLKSMRPGLFSLPSLQGGRLGQPPEIVDAPLVGPDIYVTVDDLERYRDALVSFWDEFGQAMTIAQTSGPVTSF